MAEAKSPRSSAPARMLKSKRRQFITADEVPRIFDDACIEKLGKGLPRGADVAAFGRGLRDAARIYSRDALTPNANQLHTEIAELQRAARARKYERVAAMLETLSPRARKLLEDRGARPNLQLGLPLPASMQDERQRGSSIRDPPAASKASDSNAGSDAESSVYRAGFAKPRFLLDSSRCRSVRGAGGCRGTGLGRSPRRTRLLTLIAEIQRRSRSAFNC